MKFEEIDIFIPCFVDQLFPDTAFNMIKILEYLGCKVQYNPEQTCCGQPAFNAGFWDEAKTVGEKFLNDFSGNRPLVMLSSSCTGMVRNYYTDLFHNSAQHNKWKNLRKNTFEFSEFIYKHLDYVTLKAKFPHIVTYHDACSALRECHIHNEPRVLLNRVQGLELIEMKDCDVCCGFGGTFSVKFDAISTAMTEQKVENAIATGAEYITSADWSCLMQIDTYVRKNNRPIKVVHLADILASGW